MLKNYFAQRESLFGDHINIPWRKHLEDFGDVYFITSTGHGTYMAFILPFPDKENISYFELSLTFPRNNKIKHTKLVEDIKSYIKEGSSKLEKGVI